MVAGILVTHGHLGEELLQTAQLVVGNVQDCYTLSNSSKSPQTLCEEIQGVVDGLGGEPCIIFVDFLGGSCSNACLGIDSDTSPVFVITGVNLPMLLAFLNKRDSIPFDQLPSEILSRSQNSIQIFDPSKI